MKNGSLLVQWGSGNSYQLHQISNDQWRESFQMALVKDNRVEHTLVHSDWTSVTVNGRPKDKTVEVNDHFVFHLDSFSLRFNQFDSL